MKTDWDIVVVGGGHAGCEAALVAARMGVRTALVTLRKDKIAEMSCNPAIGGLAKGHLVKEIDALGGEMGRIADLAMLQFRMLNRGKGPAVWSPRAQSDRKWYGIYMQQALENQAGLDVIEGEACGILADNGKVKGVRLADGNIITCNVVILANGTFLHGLIHVGDRTTQAGRHGEPPSVGLTESMVSLGFEVGRFKTGTPPRLDGNTIDYAKLERQDSETPQWFSHRSNNGGTTPDTGTFKPCYWTQTTEVSHQIIRDNLNLSALFSGRIKGTGPRYCPSIEDKVVRFEGRDHHPLTLEPEGRETDEVYINGLSTSLPADVQEKILKTIPGCEDVTMNRPGYAIEYDYFPPHQVQLTLESWKIDGLYLTGQILGTSGYEEAAALGLMAAINAVRKLRDQEPVILDRSQAYIGVLVDDLVTKGTEEPYRMFPSRAEWRLLLRQDNADLRLMNIGRELGLVNGEVWNRLDCKQKNMDKLDAWLKNTKANTPVIEMGIKKGEKLDQVLKRPEVSIDQLLEYYKPPFEIGKDECEQVEINIKYQGYIDRQQRLVEGFRRMESKSIPLGIDYHMIKEISSEGREKLAKIRPVNLGQASRISGVSQGDLGILMVYIKRGVVPNQAQKEVTQ